MSSNHQEKKPRVNREIRGVREVRVVDAEGQQLGVMPLRQAIEAAEEDGLDLVEVSPNAEPPVCRFMDFGKYMFNENKKRAAARKRQKQMQVKEIKFRPTTDVGDYQVKLRNLIRFLEDGDKAKVTMRFRGREMAHQEIGLETLNRVEADLADYGVVEQRPKLEGRQMVMIIAPSKKKASS